MTDKQIIIDGCDVSGCEFLRNCIIPDNYGCKIDDSLCCDVGNCYYKQLKRKEQECEELKEQLIILDDEDVVVEITVKQFEEYKKLKADREEALKQLEFVRTLNTVKEAEIKKLEKENEKLKAEIKLSKEMLIQNTSETNKYTIPQIIEQFISDNYIDQQNDDGYTIPIFLQLEDILYEKESLEEKLGLAETTKGLQRAEINRLKQTLAEIKEIAEKGYDSSQITKLILDLILQKINEAEDEN